MPIDDVAELIRRFEPVLHFHPDERFFPSDAKRYLEKSELWLVNGSKGDDKTNWGGSGPGKFPRQPKFKPPHETVPGEIGNPVTAPLGGGVEDSFLNLAGWRGGSAVTADSDNNYAGLDEIALRYGRDFNDGADKGLQDSRFWYHAEIFDLPRLRRLIGTRTDPNLMEALLSLAPDSVLLCYYLFFPGTDRGLDDCQDCEACDNEKARQFDHHAGQWTCISVLLEGVTPPGNDPRTVYSPKVLGVTSRAPDVLTTVLTEARHFGMAVHDWSLVSKTLRDRGPGKDPGEHPLLFVARQSHGFYLTPGPQPTLAPTTGDGARRTCGNFESFEDFQAKVDAVEAGKQVQSDKNSLFKWFLLFGGPIGAIIGYIYSGGSSGLAGIADENTPVATPAQLDHPPDAGNFGFVVMPAGVTSLNLPTGKKINWPVFAGETRMTTSINAREYSLMLGSQLQPFQRPAWLPSDDHKTGFRGRWGNRVTQDPQARRAGMEFMEFWDMFLLALRKAKSLP